VLERHGQGADVGGEGDRLQEREQRVKLYTSRWQNRDLEKLDVVAVGISRGAPKFRLRYRYRRLMELAPDGWMLSIEDDARFEKVYRVKLERIGVEKIAALLRSLSDEEGGRPLALLCYEANPAECHRSMFSRWWRERTGQRVEELDSWPAGQKQRGPAQDTLF
jgi:Protein of unknown function, DUF488